MNKTNPFGFLNFFVMRRTDYGPAWRIDINYRGVPLTAYITRTADTGRPDFKAIHVNDSEVNILEMLSGEQLEAITEIILDLYKEDTSEPL